MNLYNKIINKLEEDITPWRRPYSDNCYTHNWKTEKRYRDINLMLFDGREYAGGKSSTKSF